MTKDSPEAVPGLDFVTLLRRRRLLAIVRSPDGKGAFTAAAALVDAGVTLIEVSLTTADALVVIERLAHELGSAVELGAGTAITKRDAQAARDAGAVFLVTPALGPAVDEAVALGMPVLAGACSPTEVVEAQLRGATAVKLFPAQHAGGPPYLRALRDPFPDVPFVPVGGVHATLVSDYLAAGAVAVGVGSPLLGDAPRGGSLDALRQRARDYLAAVRDG